MNWKSSAVNQKYFLAAAILVDKVQGRWYNRPALSSASIFKARKKTTCGSGLEDCALFSVSATGFFSYADGAYPVPYCCHLH